MTRGGQRINAGRPRAVNKKEFTVRLTISEKDFIEFSRKKLIDLKALQKTLLTLFALLCFAMPVNAMILQGSVEYTVDKARVIAFDNTDMSISANEYSDNLKDLYNRSNLESMERNIFKVGIGSFSEARLVPFYNGKNIIAYGVAYKSNPNKKFYYNRAGELLKIDINATPNKYPRKELSYDKQGRLITASLVISESEAYIFNTNKELIRHWVNNVSYDKNGNKSKLNRRL